MNHNYLPSLDIEIDELGQQCTLMSHTIMVNKKFLSLRCLLDHYKVILSMLVYKINFQIVFILRFTYISRKVNNIKIYNTKSDVIIKNLQGPTHLYTIGGQQTLPLRMEFQPNFRYRNDKIDRETNQ